MKKFIGILLTMAVAVANQAIVRADHNYGPYSNKIGTAFSSNTGSAYTPEQRYHTGLSHRSIDRQSSHDQAHSLGLDNRQHNSLHQSISHGAFHDNQEHASFDYNLSSSIRTSEYGNLPYSRNYMSRTRSSSNPYSISPSNGNQYLTDPNSAQWYSDNYSAPYMSRGIDGSYSTPAYRTPRSWNHGNGSYSTVPQW